MPSAPDYGQFVQAVATRYSGTYKPAGAGTALPRVSFWELWNEPSFGLELAPQASNNSQVPIAPVTYRRLVGAGWSALERTGHARDAIVIGNLAPRGLSAPPSPQFPQGLPGIYSTTKPLIFIRALYCVDSAYRPLRGSAARSIGCPTTAAASLQFRASNPALFGASGFGMHPYGYNDRPPNVPGGNDPNNIDFARISHLAQALARLSSTYGSGRRLPIYNTEFGYITSPPGRRGPFLSATTDAVFLNLAEYLSYRNRRIASTMQYLLQDYNSKGTGFATGLISYRGTRKATYDAYRMPIYLPVTSGRRGRPLEVWGCARPAPYAAADTHHPQSVEIQFRPAAGGAFETLKTVPITSARGYFDVRLSFPASGVVRLAWAYPAADPLFPSSVQGTVAYSRDVHITLH
jgi:hypothetical protein